MKQFILPMLLVATMTSVSYADVSVSGDGVVFLDNASVSSSVVIGASETITNLELDISQMTHSWIGDLIVTLTHDDTGTSAVIASGIGSVGNTGSGDSSDFGGDYTFSNDGGDIWAAAAAANGSIVPVGDYFATDINGTLVDLDATFAGENTAGTWTLDFFDRANGDTGFIQNWTLNITSSPIPEPGTFGVLAIAAVAGLARRRRR